MTDPLDSNDDWAELAREFALDKPAPAEPAPEEAEAEAAPVEAVEGAPEEGEAEDDFEDGDEAAPADGESAPEGDGTGGTGRKRRRRRRRRRKGGDAAAPALVRDEGDEGEAPDEAAEPEPEALAETDEAEALARDEGDEAEDYDPEPAPLHAEEDTASEVLRELIATWNVPSWDSIVSGLYRPN